MEAPHTLPRRMLCSASTYVTCPHRARASKTLPTPLKLVGCFGGSTSKNALWAAPLLLRRARRCSVVVARSNSNRSRRPGPRNKAPNTRTPPANQPPEATKKQSSGSVVDRLQGQPIRLVHLKPVEGAVKARIYLQADKMCVTLTADLGAPLLVHWGVHVPGSEQWMQPSGKWWPPGSEVSTPRTVQTHMVQLPAGYGNCKFQSTAVFTFDLKDAPKALNFVLQDRNTGKWYAHPDTGGAYHLTLPGVMTPTGGCESEKGLAQPVPLDPMVKKHMASAQEQAEEQGASRSGLFGSIFSHMRESRAVEREARSLKGLLSEPLKGDRAMAAAVARTRKGPQMQLIWERADTYWHEMTVTHSPIKAEEPKDMTIHVQIEQAPKGWLVTLSTDLKGDLFLIWGLRRTNTAGNWLKPLKPWPAGTSELSLQSFDGDQRAKSYAELAGVRSPITSDGDISSIDLNIDKNAPFLNFAVYDAASGMIYDQAGKAMTVEVSKAKLTGVVGTMARMVPSVAEADVAKVVSPSDPPDIKESKALELARRAKLAASAAVQSVAHTEDVAAEFRRALQEANESGATGLDELPSPNPPTQGQFEPPFDLEQQIEKTPTLSAPPHAPPRKPTPTPSLEAVKGMIVERQVDEAKERKEETAKDEKDAETVQARGVVTPPGPPPELRAAPPPPPVAPPGRQSDFIKSAMNFLSQGRKGGSFKNEVSSLLDKVTVRKDQAPSGPVPVDNLDTVTESPTTTDALAAPPAPPAQIDAPAPSKGATLPGVRLPPPPPMPLEAPSAPPSPPPVVHPLTAEPPLVEAPPPSKAAPEWSPGTGTGREILLQGFNWESSKIGGGGYYKDIKEKAQSIADMGFTQIWLPPPTDSVSDEGYMPRDLYCLNSNYGSEEQLKEAIAELHKAGLSVLGDAVLNHRCAHSQGPNGIWNKFGGKLDWDQRAIVSDDPSFQGRGNSSSGECFGAAPNIDHSQDFVRADLCEWMNWLKSYAGYDGWRLDYVRGFWGGYVKNYMEATDPNFAVGEYWDSLTYSGSTMDYNQDSHRQRIINWINAAGGLAGAFDVTTKGILHTTFENCEYWRLRDASGKPPGVMGWWPSRAVTFLENHDTGSTQGHWRFPGGREAQGYAYILTHPGTPTVFFDHLFYFEGMRDAICKLIACRKNNGINCRSEVEIVKADQDVYGAIIDNKVAVKLGPGWWEPNTSEFEKVIDGNDYTVWQRRS